MLKKIKNVKKLPQFVQKQILKMGKIRKFCTLNYNYYLTL